MMTEKEQVTAFANDIDKLVERYKQEFDMTYAAAVGVLFMKAQLLSLETVKFTMEGDEEEDDE